MDFTRKFQFKEQIKKSFSSCRKDIESLQHLVFAQSNSISQLLDQSKEKDDKILILEKTIYENNNKFELLLNEISSLKKDLQLSIQESTVTSVDKNVIINQDLKAKNESVVSEFKNHSDILVQTSSSKCSSIKESSKSQDPYEALLQFKAKLNKREILKQKLITIIPSQGMVLSELKFLFVEHFKYCSKATFYNYLKELEFSKQVRIERENSRNMIYITGDVSSKDTVSDLQIDFNTLN